MPGLSIQQITVPCVQGAPGTTCKNVVSAVLSICGDLQIVETTSDTTSVYDVYLSWRGDPDWRIRIYNSASYLYCHTLIATSDGGYSTYGAVSVSVSLSTAGNEVRVEIVRAGSDMFLVAFSPSSSENASVGFCCIRVLDQFTAEEKNAYTTISSAKYYGLSAFSCNSAANGGRVSVTMGSGVSGMTPHSLTVAVPVVFYTASASLPLSGFVGTELLYYIYQGSTLQSYPSRYTRFAIDGHEFVSLGNYLCARLS